MGSLQIKKVHHIAIICSDYGASKHFYTAVLGFEILAETYREARKSYKLDLSLSGVYTLELFSFPNPPKRVSQPEATGLRHLAFEVVDVAAARAYFTDKNVVSEAIRTDEFTQKQFFFTQDPDGLPIEFYEA